MEKIKPFRFVSKAYRPTVRRMLEQVAKELSLQLIIVTHSEDLICGSVIELE